MKTSVLLTCILVTCSVWTVYGKCLELDLDDHDQVDEETTAGGGKLPGVCWACKWALNKVKKASPRNATAEELKKRLSRICDQIGFLKSACGSFVRKYLGQLVEELSTTDDVRTICVNVGVCKPKEFLDLAYDEATGIQTLKAKETPDFLQMEHY